MNTSIQILDPPITFIILLLALGLFSYLASRIAYKGKQSADSQKGYSCGEEFTEHLIQPDYSQFFPFAFYFTILHVVALVIATATMKAADEFTIAIIYVLGAIVGLFILLRRQA